MDNIDIKGISCKLSIDQNGMINSEVQNPYDAIVYISHYYGPLEEIRNRKVLKVEDLNNPLAEVDYQGIMAKRRPASIKTTITFQPHEKKYFALGNVKELYSCEKGRTYRISLNKLDVLVYHKKKGKPIVHRYVSNSVDFDA